MESSSGTGLSREGRPRVERAVGAAVAQGLREGDAVAACECEVVAAERAEALGVDVVDLQAACGEVVEGALGVDRVVEGRSR
jgi:hypothetical protein